MKAPQLTSLLFLILTKAEDEVELRLAKLESILFKSASKNEDCLQKVSLLQKSHSDLQSSFEDLQDKYEKLMINYSSMVSIYFIIYIYKS